MSKQDDTQVQRRRQAVRSYSHALQCGDLAAVATVLGEAEDDPILEEMLLKVDRLSQAQEDITVSADQLLQAQRFLRVLREEAHIGTSNETMINRQDPLMTVAGKNGTIQKGNIEHPMQKELSPTPLNSGANRKVVPRIIHFPRAAHFLQTAAAILIVGTLIACFLLVFSMRTGAPHQKTQIGAPTSSPPGIYTSSTDGVYRLDVQTRKVIWHTHVALQSPFVGHPVLIGDTLYIITEGKVSTIDAKTGTLRWSHDFHGYVTDPYMADGLLYFRILPSSQGVLYAVNPANGSIAATYKLKWGEEISQVVDGILYSTVPSVGSDSTTLSAMQLPGEKLLWQKQIGNVKQIGSEIISVQNGIIYVEIGIGGPLAAFNAHTGDKLWQLPIASGVRTVAITDKMIYVASVDGKLLAFDAHTYTLVWQKPLEVTDIQVVSGVLYTNDNEPSGHFVALNATTGKLLWQQSKGLMLICIVNGIVYSQSWSDDGTDGITYAFNASNGTQLWTMSTGVAHYVQWGGMVVA